MTTPALLLHIGNGSNCIDDRGDIVQIEEPPSEPRGVANTDAGNADGPSSDSEKRLSNRSTHVQRSHNISNVTVTHCVYSPRRFAGRPEKRFSYLLWRRADAASTRPTRTAALRLLAAARPAPAAYKSPNAARTHDTTSVGSTAYAFTCVRDAHIRRLQTVSVGAERRVRNRHRRHLATGRRLGRWPPRIDRKSGGHRRRVGHEADVALHGGR